MSRKKAEEKKRTAEPVEEFWTDISFECPVRGRVTQKVKGVRFKPVEYKASYIIEELSLNDNNLADEEDL